jgi:hypothetical protein
MFIEVLLRDAQGQRNPIILDLSFALNSPLRCLQVSTLAVDGESGFRAPSAALSPTTPGNAASLTILIFPAGFPHRVFEIE